MLMMKAEPISSKRPLTNLKPQRFHGLTQPKLTCAFEEAIGLLHVVLT